MLLTAERIDNIFKEMNGYILELENSPSALGPQYFQDIIANCRKYLNNVSLVISELNRERLEVSGELRKLEAVYALEYDSLIANDNRVKSLANVEDRKATAGFILQDKKKEINELKGQMHTLDIVYKVVYHRNRELNATMAAIKDQRRLMQTEISSGAFYGDERTFKQGAVRVDDFSADELASMLAEPEEAVTQEVESVAEETQKEQNQESKKSGESDITEEDVIHFLDSSAEKVQETKAVKEKEVIVVGDSIEDTLSFLDTL